MVGPTFFAGSVAETSRVGERLERPRRWSAFGWASCAVAVLLAFAALESQSWLSRVSGSQFDRVAMIKPVLNLLRSPWAQRPAPTVASVTVPKQLTAVSAATTTSPMPASPERRREPARTDQSSLTQNSEPEHIKVAQAQVNEASAQDASLERATTKENSDASINRANMYLEAKGAQRNCDEAIALLEAAAARSNVRAQNHLAGLYATGSCVPRDRVQAYRWLKSALATDPENHWARQNLDLTWQQMTAEERNVFESVGR